MKKEYFDALFEHLSEEEEDGEEDTAGDYKYRNPKTGEKVNTPEKKTIHFKMSKELFKKLNNE